MVIILCVCGGVSVCLRKLQTLAATTSYWRLDLFIFFKHNFHCYLNVGVLNIAPPASLVPIPMNQ